MFGLIYWLLIILTGQCNTPSNITLKKFRILNAAPEFDTPNEGYFQQKGVNMLMMNLN